MVLNCFENLVVRNLQEGLPVQLIVDTSRCGAVQPFKAQFHVGKMIVLGWVSHNFEWDSFVHFEN